MSVFPTRTHGVPNLPWQGPVTSSTRVRPECRVEQYDLFFVVSLPLQERTTRDLTDLHSLTLDQVRHSLLDVQDFGVPKIDF